MKFKKLFAKQMSLIFFYLLFPGLFIYSSLVALGEIPPYIGGGYGIISSAVVAILLPLAFIRILKDKGRSLTLALMVLSLFIYVFFFLIFHYFFEIYASKTIKLEVFLQFSGLLGQWVSLFCIGYFWPARIGKKSVYFLLLSLLLISLITISNIDLNRMILLLGVSSVENSLSYQGLARSASLTGILLLAATKNIRLAAIIISISIITLFFIGARAELVAFILMLPFLAFLYYKKRPVAITCTFLVLGIMTIGLALYKYESLSSSRQLQVFNIAESSSGSARLKLQSDALMAIEKSPVFGNLGGHIKEKGDSGSYAHSIVSVWRQIGIFGFFFYVFLLFSSIKIAFKEIKRDNPRTIEIARMIWLLGTYSIILILTAKSIFWAIPAFVWGLAISCNRYATNNINSKKA